MYEMICGRPPFEADNEDELYEAIRYEEVLYPSWISSTARGLLKQLFKKNPSQRFVDQYNL
jgi:novel protein kinase C epsilon type